MPRKSAIPNLRVLNVGLWALLVWFGTLSAPATVSAQAISGGWVIHLFGTVQVEPGSDVATLQVKDEKIRFGIHNVRCSDRNFSTGRFMSDVTHKEPGMYMKGPAPWLEMLIDEQPNKRVLHLTGTYYPDSRHFVLNNIQRFQESTAPR